MVEAQYFDGKSARARAVRIVVSGGEWVITDSSQNVLSRQPLERVRVQEPLKNSPRRIELADGAILEVADKPALARLLADAGIRPGTIERAQQSWAMVAASLIAILVFGWIGYRLLLPWAASNAARWIPQAIETRLGDEIWPVLNARMFKPSALSPQRQQALRDKFAKIAAGVPRAPSYQIEFRSTNGAPNAFALPGGRIVVTDQLVAAAGDDDALLGVLAHELGHIANRHTLRGIVQAAAVSTIVSLWVGDVSALVVTVPSMLATMRYSRDFEREADDFAIAALDRAKVSTQPLADLLETLAAQQAGSSDGGLWSSHPLTAERARRLREH
jgi:Zn-dependent protease with chaperone function